MNSYQPYYGNGYGPVSGVPYCAAICDRFWVNRYICYEPRTIVNNITVSPPKTFESRKLLQRRNAYYISERNGREVYIGELAVTDILIVNPKPDQSFDALLCTVQFGNQTEPRQIAIPYRDLVKRNILRYLPDFPRNIDCPDRYIVAAFYQELQKDKKSKFLILPEKSGWSTADGKYFFSCADSVIPQLESFYPPDIRRRRLVQTNVTVKEAAEKLKEILPDDWRIKLLLSISTSSLFLYQLNEEGYQPDRLFCAVAENERIAKNATVLLSTGDYQNTLACSLTDCKTILQRELNCATDGTVVIRDFSLLEAKKQRGAGIDLLVHDCGCGLGIDETNRHIIFLLVNNPSFLPSETPAFWIDLSGCPEADDLSKQQQAVGTFHSTLIRLMTESSTERNLFTDAFRKVVPEPNCIQNADCKKMKTIIKTGMQILDDFDLISSVDRKAIYTFLRRGYTQAMDVQQAISNEFAATLSDAIINHRISLVNQTGGPYFSSPRFCAVLDKNCINFTEDALDWIVAGMKKTKRRNNVLSALASCRKLHSNNGYKRLIDIEVSEGVFKTINVYSVPKEILRAEALTVVETIGQDEYQISMFERQRGYLPILAFENRNTAGREITDNTDQAEGIYISGQTRSGKTYFETNQAVHRAYAGQKVIILDQTDAFCEAELRKHLTEDIVKHYFSFWKISENGLPVDVLSLDRCKTVPDKKDRLCSVLSVAARISGDVMRKHLRRRLSDLIKGLESGSVQTFSDTLKVFDQEDPAQEEICSRLEDVADDLEGLERHRQDWGEFLSSQAPIVVVSAGSDGIRKTAQLFDLLMADLYFYKQHERESRFTVILDEIEDLCLDRDGPLSMILRKAGKLRLSLVLASQEYSIEKDLLGKLIGNCDTHIFFRPKDANLRDISKILGCEISRLANLSQGECAAVGSFFSKRKKKNCRTTLWGRACPASDFTTNRHSRQDIIKETGTAAGGERE